MSNNKNSEQNNCKLEATWYFVCSIGAGEQLPSGGPSWQAPRAPGPVPPKDDVETEHLSHNKINIMKWEKDEPLGLNATISPVLFANTHHPDLIGRYPGETV